MDGNRKAINIVIAMWHVADWQKLLIEWKRVQRERKAG